MIEIFVAIDHNATLRSDTVVMVWKGERENLTFTDEIARVSHSSKLND